MIPHLFAAALTCACVNSLLSGRAGFVSVSETTSSLDLVGFRLGMTPQEVVAAAKARGLTFEVHREPKPGGDSYPASVLVGGPTPVRIQFSAVTQAADEISVTSAAPIMPGSGPDPLFQAALTKWGRWDGSSGFPGMNDVPAVVWWGDREKAHAEYSNSNWTTGSPSTVELRDTAAMKASEAFLRGEASVQAPKL
jgi:hypothetical protein